MPEFRINYRLSVPDYNPCPPAAVPSLPRSIAPSSSSLSSASASLTCCEEVRYYFFKCIKRIHFFFQTLFYVSIVPDASRKALKKTYYGLSNEKWKECIDGKYHHLGKDVFKLGTHGGCKEPEYVPSMEKAFKFCATFLNKKVDSNWYLRLHQITCGHFDGDPDVYLMGQEKVGVFRTSNDHIHWWPANFYTVTQEAKDELAALNAEIAREFGPGYGLGEFILDPQHNCIKHVYKTMQSDQVQEIFDKFMTEFYAEIEQAQTQDAKLTAIARLNKRLELLHPPRDGSGRTNTALINKILTEYGFHPAILDQPFVSTTYGLARWTQYLKDGLLKWEAERS